MAPYVVNLTSWPLQCIGNVQCRLKWPIIPAKTWRSQKQRLLYKRTTNLLHHVWRVTWVIGRGIAPTCKHTITLHTVYRHCKAHYCTLTHPVHWLLSAPTLLIREAVQSLISVCHVVVSGDLNSDIVESVLKVHMGEVVPR